MQNFLKINNELCLTVDAVAAGMGVDALTAINTIKRGLLVNRKQQSDSWRHYPHPSDRRRKLIAYESIPPQNKSRVLHHYGNLMQCFYAEQFTSEVEKYYNQQDIAWFQQQQIDKNEHGFTLEEAKDLAQGCAWMRMLAAKTLYQHFGKKGIYYEKAAIILSQQRPLYGLRVSNGRTLERRVKKWEAEGRSSFISKKWANKNGKKVKDLGLKYLLFLRANHKKLTYQKITELYNRAVKMAKWEDISEEVSVERVRQILKMPEHKQLIYAGRHGTEAYRKLYERTIKRRKPSFPDALWSLDGCTIQLVYQDSGKTLLSGIYAVVVQDVHSDCFVGFKAVVGTETASLVQRALHEACRNSGMLPLQLQYDNSSANLAGETKELFGRLAKVAFPCQPYNGKGKPVECLIGRMESRFLRHYDNFKGGNITSHSLEYKANPDVLKQLAKEGKLPNADQVLAQVELAILTHNNTKGKDGLTPKERYQKQNEQRRPMDFFTQIEAFWVKRKKPARYTKDGITIEVEKIKYTYEVTQTDNDRLECPKFRKKYLGDRFDIRYDPDDLEQINLYQNDRWVATANQKFEAAMAVVDLEEGERVDIDKAIHQRQETLQQKFAELETLRDTITAENLGLPTYENLHKDALNEIEKGVLDDLLERTGRLDMMEKPKKRKRRYSLVNADEADGSIIEDF